MQGFPNSGNRIFISNFQFLPPYEVLGNLVTTLRLKSTQKIVSSLFKFLTQQSNRLNTIEKAFDSDKRAV